MARGVLPAVVPRIDAHGPLQSLRVLLVGVDCAIEEKHRSRRRPYDDDVLGRRRLLTWSHEHVLSAPAAVGARQTKIGQRTLPEIHRRAGDQARGHVHDRRPVLTEVGVENDVGRRQVRREKRREVRVPFVGHDVAGPGAGRLAMEHAKLGEADDGQGPQIGLARSLKIDLIEQASHRLGRRHAELELENPDRSFYRLDVRGAHPPECADGTRRSP